MQFIDSHSHLNSDAFDEDRDEVIARMKAAGMAAAMVIACEDDELPKLEALLAEHPGWLFGAWALHPEFPDKPEPTVERIAEICSRPGFAAVGETGLDFVHGPSREVQTEALRAQLRLARERGLPVVLHCVRAFEPLMRELAASEPRAVIFHGFIGSPEQARQALAKGYCLSFGERTFASPKTLAALRGTPLSQLFLETDDSPVPIAEIYARAAEAKGVPEEELQRAILDNYKRIFTGGEYEGPGRTKGDK